ncbi:MAG TPA: efflux RND transporter periplasmic adaptor subunit [Bacteroidales bacterium]|nr:efflux RND transporter periplasmic adaptor subunit [Bacteroidales bacterium]HPF03290.1 efflux RND transporter periplasmic adaptor subunit [Bacteroidales bacterium]HPJ58085.1 efflux RND transporter periplasmic adaptor subunit [Bacteroidales bacterium]HPR12430.1 efflux RND transporter periplasmic adaptor subunit [Bacteroidales bacterium]HRW84495.1 efflux RND transporter periplasmic adaptor subunit [Bacteroidales bacterium]
MKKKIIITSIVAAVAIIALIVYNALATPKDLLNLFVEAQQGQFDIIVTTTGELQAENSTDIYGPQIAQSRNIRAMDIKITDLVPEGTEVKAGDYVATLDRTSFDNSLKDELERLTTYETNLEVKILDTAVTLSNLRDNIKNLRFNVEEAEITVEQSKYEPPTTQRQAEIALDKARRSLEQSLRGYTLRVEQARSDMRNMRNNLAEQRQRVSDLQELLSKFIITAPADGMVIYKRDRTGTKRKVGSSISAWDNVVATLPDMSSMISKTYVNEIDVSKVKTGQRVDIVVDAFPDKKYTGTVTSVANIGEQLPNADAKVFEVLIKVDGSDLILRPSMTTGNKIITKSIPDVTFIPLESVQAGSDSIPYVYMKNGTKQIVVLGESNENHIIVEQGINPGDQLFLNTPEEPERYTKLLGEELIPTIREKEKIRKEAERKAAEQATQPQRRGMGGRGGFGGEMTPEMREQFQNMRNGGQIDTAAMRRFRETRERTGGQQGQTQQGGQQPSGQTRQPRQ